MDECLKALIFVLDLLKARLLIVVKLVVVAHDVDLSTHLDLPVLQNRLFLLSDIAFFLDLEVEVFDSSLVNSFARNHLVHLNRYKIEELDSGRCQHFLLLQLLGRLELEGVADETIAPPPT